ncbi:polysaccharide pyruvyl transferase family protein [Paenibacillus sp. V4I5]|uniref:polysaccharide pyruvyl transferase family protein n=1 Tax=Paenibacillus sp. V4I5 TaxID=3042306 RepID=UPI00278F3324|nr:polysaccharide pyruvyl transferase family protein [Paenibacillus sp. V4I5]MDQ0917499.1 polysaccharide pyruvyl transferase WcaK-like protein [Paenibacillus sp. V4I5]
MENVLLLDTSVGSLNKGDEIIMKCARRQLSEINKNNFVMTLPTHVPAFHWYQVVRRSYAQNFYKDAKYKFVCGTNLLTMDMFNRFPQWNINLFNCEPLRNSILVGVGAGRGEQISNYTKKLYKKVLSHKYIHSVRDERTKRFMEDMGFKVLNTGCPTMWSLTPELCKEIPTGKSESVIFTLTDYSRDIERDQKLINILNANYKNVYFWLQGSGDYKYFKTLDNIQRINIIPPSVEAYENMLSMDIDYVGTRLHAGIFAMGHKKRSIIISIDERARGMDETYNLNVLERKDINKLEEMIHSKIITNVNVNYEVVNKWLAQFQV